MGRAPAIRKPNVRKCVGECMRNLGLLKMVAPLALAAMSAAPAIAGNGGFETQDLTDWTVNTPFSDATNLYDGYTPVSGKFFAHVDAGLGLDVESTLSQTFTLAAGSHLVGYAGFKANDYLPNNDSAHLSINGIDQLYWDVASVGDYGASGWTHFSFTAPVAGDYVLALSVADHGDDGMPSFAVLDAVTTTPAPEPASWAMMVGGFGMIGGALRTRSRKLRFA